ncbi:unnamed protein product [Eruca vesicaria subsp. sativa]|uniref:Protein ABIL4 n=1 Tax=Eruca vesicaria subsp. sativa TaxID=29727 RepID=A0ABC8J3P2_ERUVS|nr:unnamed protein product [Eruca vesicaria subsp. sativa]
MECVKESAVAPLGSLSLTYSNIFLFHLSLSLFLISFKSEQKMESSTSLAIVLHQSSNHDELFMQQTLQFSQTLKDLKNLRKQLYSAAEYFETSYGKEEHKETVIETLKEYAAKAVVNTVDHLGSVSDKFNSFLSDNSAHFSTTRTRLSSLEQRMKLCREYMGKSGTYQHCFRIQFPPHHHKRYFFPQHGRGTSFAAGDDSHRFKSAVRSTILENHPITTTTRKANKTGSFSFLPIIQNNISNRTPNSTGKRENSPVRFSLLRSGSLLKRSSSPSQPRMLALLPEPQRAISLSTSREIVEIKQKSSLRKGKKSLMLKALMSMSSKSKN